MNIEALLTSASQINLRPVELPKAPTGQPGSLGTFREVLTKEIQGQSQAIGENAGVNLHPTYQSAIHQSNNVVTGMIDDVQQLQSRANAITKNVLSGKSDSIHGAMIAMEEASVSFQMLVAMRNKVVESLQELMRMQI